MRLTERTTQHSTYWIDECNISQFLYYAEDRELYSNERYDDVPIAHPATLEIARYIITQAGHTIA